MKRFWRPFALGAALLFVPPAVLALTNPQYLLLLAQQAGFIKASQVTGSVPISSGIRAEGDSLMSGAVATNGITVPSELATVLSVPVINEGIGGQVSTQIAMRAGGIVPQITVSGNVIATVSGTTVTAIQGVAVAGMSTTQTPDYRFLQTAADNLTRRRYGTLCGIHGTLEDRNNSGGPPSTSAQILFTPDINPAAPVACAAASNFTDDAYALSKNPTIIEEGRNNYSATSQVESDIAASVANADPSAYLVFGITKGEYANEYTGQTGATQINTINTNSASLYGAHYFDWNAYLITQANNSNIMDQADVTNGVVPFSLRGVALTTTLNGAMLTTGCPTVAAATLLTGTMFINDANPEFIDIGTASGSTATVCTRAQGTGGVASAHSSGATVTVTDRIHLGTGYKLTADYIAAMSALKAALLGKYTSQVSSPPSDWSDSYGPTFLQGRLTLAGLTSSKGVLVTAQDPLGCFYAGSDSSGNAACLVSLSGATEYIGGSYIAKTCFGSGGPGGICPYFSDNNGNFTLTKSIIDQSAPAAVVATAGQTVVMADTSNHSFITPAGTLATMTLQLPSCNAAYSGKRADVLITQAVTALTVTATAGSIVGAPAAFIANSDMLFKCESNSTWYHQVNQ